MTQVYWPKICFSIFQVFYEHDDRSSDYNIEHENLRECQFGTLMLDANTNLKIASADKLYLVPVHLLLHPPTLLISACYQARPYRWTQSSRRSWSFTEVEFSKSHLCLSSSCKSKSSHWQDKDWGYSSWHIFLQDLVGACWICIVGEYI